MTATLTIRDEAVGSDEFQEWALEVLTERISVRELIRSRVYQEVQDANRDQPRSRRSLVSPEATEAALNGEPKRRVIDWKKQFDLALEAFERQQVLILVNDVQAESLEQEIVIEPGAAVTFLRLRPLVGG